MNELLHKLRNSNKNKFKILTETDKKEYNWRRSYLPKKNFQNR